MRKKFVQIAAFLLALILWPALPASALAGEEDETMIRVGLYYGSSALPGANLQNDVGSGYRFGYMDADTFCQIGFTEETKISMVKAQNVWYSSSLSDGLYGYSDQAVSDLAVGCYHLRLPETYATFEQARARAAAVGGFPAWIQGEYQVRIGAYTSREEAERAALQWPGATVAGTSSYGITVVITGASQPIFQFDGGEQGAPAILVVRPGLDDSVKTVTYFKNKTYYGSFCYERLGGGDLTVVNLVSMEDYVRGILPYEMSNSFPLEALKAQAVCARSYTMTNLNKHAAYHFDVCNTTDCQVYSGTGSANDRTDQAADETRGEYAWYDGAICETYYHSCDGGATESSGNVWNDDLPYLQGVSDPYEALVEDQISGYRWTRTYTGKELQDLMITKGHYTTCGEVAQIQVTETTPTGNVYSVTVTDVNGASFTVSKNYARTVFGVNSLRYTISGGGDSGEYAVTGGGTLDGVAGAWTISEDGLPTQIKGGCVYAVTGSGTQVVTASAGGAEGTFVFSGTGHGHNVGMSQWGAYAMALEGYTYEEILRFYFTGIEIG